MPVKMEFPQGWGFDSLLDHTGMLDSWLGGAMVAREIPALMIVFFFGVLLSFTFPLHYTLTHKL